MRKKQYNHLLERIQKLEKLLSEDITTEYAYHYSFQFGYNAEVPTIKAKVDEILKHLNLDVSVKEGTSSKVVTKKLAVKSKEK